MTKEEILNTPEIVDFMLDKSVIEVSRMKLHKRLEVLCKLAVKALEQESCEDCISRAGALRHRHIIYDDDGIGYSVVRVDEIEKLPPVTPKYTDEEIDRAQAVEQAYIDKMVELTVEELKRPKGEWIDIEYFDREWTCYRPKCPFCNAEPKEYSNYCPKCGAKLREEDPDY